MALGKVTIQKVDLAAGGLNSVEQTTLYIGVAAAGAKFDKVAALSQQTDLDAVFGEGESSIKSQVKAAALNAGPNFTAWAVPLEQGGALDFEAATHLAINAPYNIYPEKVAHCDPITSKAEAEALQALKEDCINTYAKYCDFFFAVSGIGEEEDWADYAARIKPIVQGVAADGIVPVPLTHGNNLGVLLGRLDNDQVAIADSPMRVLTGAVVGLGQPPEDKDGVTLDMGIIGDLHNERFSMPQTYTGYDGTYWTDCLTLAAEGSDFQEYEAIRIWQYVARRIRILAIQQIANRSFNPSGVSTNYYSGYFMQPIIDASKSVVIGDLTLPGLVQPPKSSDISISWPTNKKVIITVTVAPYGSPKSITAAIAIDLNRIAE